MRKNNQYKHLGLKPEEEQVFSGAPLIDKYDGSQHSHIQLYMDDETAEMPTWSLFEIEQFKEKQFDIDCSLWKKALTSIIMQFEEHQKNPLLWNFKGLNHFKTEYRWPWFWRCFSSDKLDQIDEEIEEESESEYEIELLPRCSSFPRMSKDKEVDITFKNFCDKLWFDSLSKKNNNNVYAEVKPWVIEIEVI